jgi:hypothetical protein
MCQSYRKACKCGQKTAEIFFGRMVLDERAIAQIYCPKCSQNINIDEDRGVWDNDWVLELNMNVVRSRANTMGFSPEEVTAERGVDEGFATWVGITPDDFQKREEERSEIQEIAKTDLRAYIEAMRKWGQTRERRFIEEGWRKMRVRG